NTERFDEYITILLTDAKYKNLTLSTLPKESYLNTLEAGREHLAKLQKRIDTRIKYFDEKPMPGNPEKLFKLRAGITPAKVESYYRWLKGTGKIDCSE